MKRGSIFETDGIPRIQEALPLALQHVVAMIVGCVTPAIIVAGAANADFRRLLEGCAMFENFFILCENLR